MAHWSSNTHQPWLRDLLVAGLLTLLAALPVFAAEVRFERVAEGVFAHVDAAPWGGLVNSAELHPGNASRTYLEVERE